MLFPDSIPGKNQQDGRRTCESLFTFRKWETSRRADLFFFSFSLAPPGSLWDPIPLTRDQTHTLNSESTESELLDHQGIPQLWVFKAEDSWLLPTDLRGNLAWSQLWNTFPDPDTPFRTATSKNLFYSKFYMTPDRAEEITISSHISELQYLPIY